MTALFAVDALSARQAPLCGLPRSLTSSRQYWRCFSQRRARYDEPRAMFEAGKRAVGRIAALRAGLSASSAAVLGFLFAASFALQVGCADAGQDGLTIRFKASKDPAIRQVQEALVETWGYVGTQFYDSGLNGVDWPQELQGALDKSFGAESPQDVFSIIDGMLKKLGDPFTRVIPPSVAGAFENATEGQVVGMGFQVSKDSEGLLRVGLVADDSPAKAAGIRPGDRLLAVDGKRATGYGQRELATLLRGEATLTMQRRPPQEGSDQYDVRLKAKTLEVHPVQYAVLPGPDGQEKVGYVRLVVFSKNASRDVEDALKALEAQSVGSVMLDLRDNSGGVVLSAYQVSQLFLPQGASFCFVTDGRGASEDVKLAESNQLTTRPLVVLVNGGTASSAELIAASLRDNHRAFLLGEKTFGKGRTQRIIPLKGGALLLLSNTVYYTPEHVQVDKVGLQPDVACKPEITETEFWASGEQSDTERLLDDPCIRMARDKLTEGRA